MIRSCHGSLRQVLGSRGGPVIEELWSVESGDGVNRRAVGCVVLSAAMSRRSLLQGLSEDSRTNQ